MWCKGLLRFEDGLLSQCELAAAAWIDGLDLPEGAQLSWKEGRMDIGGSRSSRASKLPDVPGCRSPYEVWISGGLRTCVRTTPTRIGGLDVPEGAIVETDPWGRVRSVKVSDALTVQGAPCRDIRFGDDGAPSACRLAATFTTADGTRGEPHLWVEFDGDTVTVRQ